MTIATAGGTDDGRPGTSMAKIQRALRLADAGAGVMILPDLGSSVLTVRALLAEPEDLPGQVVMADAPFVEGAVAAAVTAAAGGDLKAVLDAAGSNPPAVLTRVVPRRSEPQPERPGGLSISGASRTPRVSH